MKKMGRNRLNQGAGSSPEFGTRGGEREPRDLGDAALASQGDVAAFSRLVEANSGLVRGVALRVMGAEDAEDACQEVWVRVWLNIARFRGDSAFTTWLYRVATNTCLGLRRARTRREARRRDGEESFLPEPSGGDTDPVASVLRAERRGEMVVALGNVRSEHRTALVLRHAEGFSYAEIAELLGVPNGTAKGWTSRGRAGMLLALTKEDGAA
jgi:RNA polymerase sigma-70 factor, ECF subfamily